MHPEEQLIETKKKYPNNRKHVKQGFHAALDGKDRQAPAKWSSTKFTDAAKISAWLAGYDILATQHPTARNNAKILRAIDDRRREAPKKKHQALREAISEALKGGRGGYVHLITHKQSSASGIADVIMRDPSVSDDTRELAHELHQRLIEIEKVLAQ